MKRCEFCDAPIQYLKLATLQKIPFDFNPIPLDDLPDGVAGWIPERRKVRGGRSIMVMVTQDRALVRRPLHRVVTVHRCPQYEALKAAAGLSDSGATPS